MDIKIVIMSMITYLLMFNRSLTFRLTVFNNVVIAVVLAACMIIMEPLAGNLFVIPMFAVLMVYIYFQKREDGLWNIF